MKMMGFAGLNPSYELHVIARSAATKQSILSYCGKMDCFASLAMTAGAMDCVAEPVIGRATRAARWRAMTEEGCFMPLLTLRHCELREAIHSFLLWQDGLLVRQARAGVILPVKVRSG